MLQNGSVFFSQCTFLDGNSVCRIPANSKGDITIVNSIMARCSSFFLEVQERKEGKVILGNNIYWDGKGNIFNGKNYNTSNWDEYIKTGLEKSSRWINPGLCGNLASELPKNSAFDKAGLWLNPEIPEIIFPLIPEDSIIKLNMNETGKNCRIGAELSKKLWKAYFNLLEHDNGKQF